MVDIIGKRDAYFLCITRSGGSSKIAIIIEDPKALTKFVHTNIQKNLLVYQII